MNKTLNLSACDPSFNINLMPTEWDHWLSLSNSFI